MKVLLIYPPVTKIRSDKVITSHAPMGLMYLAAYIKKAGYQVKLLDALANGPINRRHMGMSWSQIRSVINNFEPEVIGLSVMFTAYYDDALSLVKKIKKYYPKIKIVLGGSHVSIEPKLYLKEKEIDFIVYGEGEITFEKLLKELEKGTKNYSKINGLAFKIGRKLVVNQPAEVVKNLDDLPFPDWKMLSITNYNLGNQSQLLTDVMRKPCFTMVTSRGCPNHCIYCSSFAVWRHCWRGRSPQNVVDEIESLVKNFGAREISFYDDSMSVSRERFKGICEEIIRRKLDIKWSPPNGIAHWTLDKELLKLMKKSGCYRITFGIESGDVETRRWVGKPYNLEQAKELTKYANNLGIWTVATNIIGFPYETKEQINKTLDFAINSEVDNALFFRLGLRPGAPVYDIFKKEGWLPKDLKTLYSENISLDTKYIKGSELVQIQSEMVHKFWKERWGSPRALIRVIKKIRSFEDLLFAIKQMYFIYNLGGKFLGRKVV